MRFYNQQHQYYCSVDVHARSMFTHVLDRTGGLESRAIVRKNR